MNFVELTPWVWLPALIVKGGVLLLIAFGCSFVLRNKGGAILRVMWSAVWIGMFFLPIGFLISAWELQMPNQAASAMAGSSTTTPLTAPAAEPRIQPATESAVAPSNVAVPPAVPVVEPAATSKIEMGRVVGVIWLAGVVLGLAYFVVGRVMLLRIELGSEPADEKWYRSAGVVAARLGIGGRLRIRVGGGVRVPMTIGLIRPTIMVPASSDCYDPVQREAVLIHELTHMKGWDLLVILFAYAAAVTHWFNPLAWLALRALRFSQERTCDDAVLRNSHGENQAEDYADLLLVVARDSRIQLPAFVGTALTMAHHRQASSLRRRINLVLDRKMKRNPLTKLQSVQVAAAVTALAAPIVMLGLGGSVLAAGKSTVRAGVFDDALAQSATAAALWETGEWQDHERLQAKVEQLLDHVEDVANCGREFNVDLDFSELTFASPDRRGKINRIEGSVIAADRLEISHARSSLILAADSVEIANAQDCVIISRGAVHISHGERNIVLAGHYIRVGHDGNLEDVGNMAKTMRVPADRSKPKPESKRPQNVNVADGSILISGSVVHLGHANGSVVCAPTGASVSLAWDNCFINTPDRTISRQVGILLRKTKHILPNVPPELDLAKELGVREITPRGNGIQSAKVETRTGDIGLDGVVKSWILVFVGPEFALFKSGDKLGGAYLPDSTGG